MRARLLLFLFLLPGAARAQYFEDLLDEGHSRQAALAISAGQYNTDFAVLNKQLELYGAKTFLTENYRTIGLDGAGYRSRISSKFDYAFSLQAILPQRVPIGSREHAFRFGGWQIMSSYFGKDLIPGSTFAFIVAPALHVGSFRMRRQLELGEDRLYKNFFIAPSARAELRMVFWNVAVGARLTYRYDLSKGAWRRKVDTLSPLPDTHNRGWGVQVFVGRGYKRK